MTNQADEARRHRSCRNRLYPRCRDAATGVPVYNDNFAPTVTGERL